MIDWTDTDDKMGVETVVHRWEGSAKDHLLSRFPLAICPCGPEITMEAEWILVYHRPVQ